MAEQIRLMAWQFTYLKGREEEYKFETMPFYLQTLRNFLRENLGKVVWIKGAVIEKPAYLLFYSELAEKIFRIMVKPLKDGGRFGVIPVKNPIETARKYLREERLAVGYLDLKTNYIGSRETLYTPEEKELFRKIDYINGFILKDGYTMVRAEACELKMVERRKPGTQQIESKPMLILTNAVEILLDKDGRIIGEDKVPKPQYGIWVELVKQNETA